MGRWIDGEAGETEGLAASGSVALQRKEPFHRFAVPSPSLRDREET